MYLNKFKASIYHLLISLLLVTLIIGCIIFLFFPQNYISITDFKEVALIIITVDLILGPILTFVVFQPQKKSLKFDLSVVAAIQLTALIYGAYALYQVHPVYITFNVDRFTIVNARDATPERAIFDEYKVSKLSSANLAYAKIPEDPSKRSDLNLSAVLEGRDLDQHVEYYEPYKDNIDHIIAKGLNKKLILNNVNTNKKIKNFVENNKEQIDQLVFLPINSSSKDGIIVLDKSSGIPIGTINTDPWLLSKN